MYYPYLRAKQFELIMLRENASLISKSGIVPIIEPVKEKLAPLVRGLKKLVDSEARFLLILNPKVGELNGQPNIDLTKDEFKFLSDYENCSPAFILTANESIEEAQSLFQTIKSDSFSIIHSGFQEGNKLSSVISDNSYIINTHVFTESKDRLYRKYFSEEKRILIESGFNIQPNKNYPESEPFSDLYLTYTEENMNGFGDYLIVGKDYRSGGGPAYSVAIHLTYVEPNADNQIFVKHYKSIRCDTPKDPAGKFFEALTELNTDCLRDHTKIKKTNAVDEYLSLFQQERYPGLGYVKKLSMQHHIELLADLL